LQWFAVQLALNAARSPVFLGLRRIGLVNAVMLMALSDPRVILPDAVVWPHDVALMCVTAAFFSWMMWMSEVSLPSVFRAAPVSGHQLVRLV
jgi:tryptophan-rich sensory protein